jgi:hypothetical protein
VNAHGRMPAGMGKHAKRRATSIIPN